MGRKTSGGHAEPAAPGEELAEAGHAELAAASEEELPTQDTQESPALVINDEIEGTAAAPARDLAQTLAGFYDRRAPAALAYAARLCEPDQIADAVEEAFGELFTIVAGVEPLPDDDELERLMRQAIRTASATRVQPVDDQPPATHAERAYDALATEDAPALGRSLLGEVIAAGEPEAEDGISDAVREALATNETADEVEQAEPELEEAGVSEEEEAPAEEPPPAPLSEAATSLARALADARQTGGAGASTATAPQDDAVADAAPSVVASPAVTADAAPSVVASPAATHDAPADTAQPTGEPVPTRHPWRRRAIVLLAAVGVLLIAEAAVTLAWKEPLTAYLAAQSQDDLTKQLDDRDLTLSKAEQQELATIKDADARTKKRMSLLATQLEQDVPEGEALGRIQIDKLGIDFVFVQGTDGASLRKGPGHYDPDTALPGQTGVVGIAGHRTTYEAPFRRVDELRAGDTITLRMPYGIFSYEVTGHRIVPADYAKAFAADEVGGGGAIGGGPPTANGGDGGQFLVLSACHPLYSATERILVDAKLVTSQPLGSAVETAVPAVPVESREQIARRRTAARLRRLGDRRLGPGTTGPDVRELQRLLGMPVTGTFDANTGAAVTAFQSRHGLPQVGVVGSQTKRALARQPHLPTRPPTPAPVPEQKPPDESGAQGTSTTPYQQPYQQQPYQQQPYQQQPSQGTQNSP